MGYIRGYFKWGQIPTALSAFLLLLATLVFGIINMAVFVEHKRTVLAWPPWKTYDPAVDATVPVDANLATAIRFVLLVNCIIVAIAIFYAGAFPLYKYNNTKRYPNKLQDNLASFGWFFLAMHHIGNISMIILLTAGLRAWAGALPVLLILPTLHFILKGLLPEFPPSAHYWLGLCVDITHFPLIGLYAWRASTLDAPFELYGMAAELLHVLSVIPETYATCTRPAQTGSFANPKGYDYEPPAGLVSRPGTLRRGPSHHTAPLPLTSPSYTRGAMSPRQGASPAPHVQVEMGPVLDLATAASSGNIDVRLQAGAQGSSSHDIQAAIKLDPVITSKIDKASAPEDKPPPLGEAMAALAAPPKEPPVYAMLVLFNVASFFFYGGLIAMQ